MKRNLGLDGIRGLAALSVLLFHTRVPGFGGGFFGVDVFFVLSGFLITSLLSTELASTDRIAFGTFYLRRFFRLMPALLAVLAVYLAASPLVFPQITVAAHLRDVMISAAYLSDYALAFWHVPKIVAFTWSLSIEEHYYLLWPLVLLAVMRFAPISTRLGIMVTLFAVATLWRWQAYSMSGDWMQVYFRFDTRMSGLLLGGAVALLPPLPDRWFSVMGLLGIAGLMFAFVTLRANDPAVIYWGMTLVEGSVAALILALARKPDLLVGRALALRPLVALGAISYAIYLWHYPIAMFGRGHLPWLPLTVMTLGLTLLMATLSYFMIEAPILRWQRDRRPKMPGY